VNTDARSRCIIPAPCPTGGIEKQLSLSLVGILSPGWEGAGASGGIRLVPRLAEKISIYGLILKLAAHKLVYVREAFRVMQLGWSRAQS
jgi:hypothetical protein